MTDAGEIELRLVVPRSALGGGAEPRAEFISQHNSEAILGIPRRQFLELLRRDDAPPVAELGKLRLVEREPMLAFLRTLRKRSAPAPADEDLDGADRVLREIGAVPEPKRRVG